MNKMSVMILTTAAFFVFGLFAAGSDAAAIKRESGMKEFEIRSLIGAKVDNLLGLNIGTIRDVIGDSNGHIDFVILTHEFYWQYTPIPSQTVAVPFEEIALNPAKHTATLKISAWKLDFAPRFESKDLRSQNWVSNDYRYFGVRPDWTK